MPNRDTCLPTRAAGSAAQDLRLGANLTVGAEPDYTAARRPANGVRRMTNFSASATLKTSSPAASTFSHSTA
jgi:hypothetical protein